MHFNEICDDVEETMLGNGGKYTFTLGTFP